jgi:hypothetical protein
VRSCCVENNEVVGSRIGALERFFNITLTHKTLKVRINLSAVFSKSIIDLAIDSP